MLVDFLGYPDPWQASLLVFWFTTLRELPAYGQKLLPALYDFCANFCQLGLLFVCRPFRALLKGEADALCLPLPPPY